MTTAIANPYQHTRDWFMARRGKLTSSRMKTIVHGGPRGWTTLIRKLRAELESPEPIEPDLEHVPAIAHGRKYEPIARAELALTLDTELELVGFAMHPQLEHIGCSSDALAWNRTVNVEIKCPLNLEVHDLVYQTRRLPDGHKAQVHCQMFVHQCDQTLFVSYHPDALHWRVRTVIVEVKEDRGYRDLMLERCEQFMQAFNGEAPVVRQAISIPKLF